ncbi:MAG: hypothetical protein ACERLG_08975, partial [Sedimentibacter sp.]
MYKRIIAIVFVVAVIFLGGYFTAKQLVPDSSQVSTGPRYSTKAVVKGDIKQGVNISGQLNGNYGGSITAPKPEGITDSNGMSVSVQYTVEEVLVEPNQMIKKGDNLKLKTERGTLSYKVIGYFDSKRYSGSYGLIGEKYIKSDMG